jgi:hypothetical protein
LAPLFDALGNPRITPELKRPIAERALQEAESRSVKQLAKDENKALVGLLRLRAKAID